MIEAYIKIVISMVSFYHSSNNLRDKSSDFFFVPVFLYTNLLEAHLFQNLSHLCSYNEAKPVLVKRKSTAMLVYLLMIFNTILLEQINIFKLSTLVSVYVACLRQVIVGIGHFRKWLVISGNAWSFCKCLRPIYKALFF